MQLDPKFLNVVGHFTDFILTLGVPWVNRVDINNTFAKHQPSPSRSEASTRKNVDVVRGWYLGVTSPLKVLQNAYFSIFNMAENL